MKRLVIIAPCLAFVMVAPIGLTASPARADEIVVEGTDSVIGIHRDELTDQIERAIRKGCIYLRDTQARNGSWMPPDAWDLHERAQAHGKDERAISLGSTAVILMGLMYSGANPDSPTVRRGLKLLAENEGPVDLTYTRGAMCCAFIMADPRHRNRDITKLVEKQILWLLKSQEKNRTDLWRYTFKTNAYDMSCVQFALEALRMADVHGMQLPKGPLEKARKAVWSYQLQDGGWPYSGKPDNPENKSTASMTAATVASLSFLDAVLAEPRRGAIRRDPHIASGLKALDKKFDRILKRTLKQGHGQHYIYYSIERAGILTGTRFIGGKDWYRTIAKKVLKEQNKDGSWPSYRAGIAQRNKCLGTGFTLLFLGKGLAPTIVGKLDWGPSSRGTPWDMRHLTNAVTREVATHLNWFTLPVEADVSEYMKAPLIYITGADDPYDKLVKHKAKFVEYLNAGGTILGAGFDNGEKFEEGFKKFVAEIQPGAEFERVDLDHNLYKSWHTIRRRYGLYATLSDKGGRPVALFIDKPFAIPLGTRRGSGVKQSMELGTNIVIALTQIDKRRSIVADIFED